MSSSHYTGRFAPSPSGPLHFGSLVCAVASFVDAKANKGKWLLRIEDIDPPREQQGAAAIIANSLQQHGLHWDGDIIYQSQNSQHYNNAIETLFAQGFLYQCTCTRKRLAGLSQHYDGFCRDREHDADTPASIRINLDKTRAHHPSTNINDAIQGQISNDMAGDGDFVIHRKDGLFAYQLAVVVDDIAQEVTHIVRGTDLLDCTAKHMLLTSLLGGKQARFAHIPVLTDNSGLKLSKQNRSPAIDDTLASDNIFNTLNYLQQAPPPELKQSPPDRILQWAIEHWQPKRIPAQSAITFNTLQSS